MYDGQIVECEGRNFRVNLEMDNDHEPPWENDCGAGVVSDWECRYKKPHEWVVSRDHGAYRFYDVKASTAKAVEDSWGLCDKERLALEKKLKRVPTRKEIVAEAVRRDYERHRTWCADLWYYIGVVVTDVTEDEDAPTTYSHSLWGIESDAGDYLDEVAYDLIDSALREHRAEDENYEKRKEYDEAIGVAGAFDIFQRLKGLLVDAEDLGLAIHSDKGRCAGLSLQREE